MRRTSLSLFLVFAFGAAGCSTVRTSATTPDSKIWDEMQACAKKAPEGRIHETCADSFKDKLVTGNIREAKASEGHVDLGISVSETPMIGRYVTCQLDAGVFRDQASRLTQGDAVTVRGEMRSLSTNPSFTEIVLQPCEVTNSPPPTH